MRKLLLFGVIFCLSFALFANGASEQSTAKYPSQPIQIIVPAKAGGDTDLYARLIAKHMEEDFGVTVTCVNVVGGGGSIGAQQVIDANADGYTLLFATSTNLILTNLMGVVDYDYTEFKHIGIPIMDYSQMLIADKKFAGKTFNDVVADLKANPGCYNYGTEVGSLGILSGLVLESAAGVSFNLVDTGTMADRIAAMLAGKIDMFFGPYSSLKDYIANGDFIPLALFSSVEQPELLPGVKTFEELGYKGCTFNKAFNLSVNKKTSDEIVDILRSELKKICESKSFADELAAYGIVPQYRGEAETNEFFETTTAQFKPFESQL